MFMLVKSKEFAKEFFRDVFPLIEKLLSGLKSNGEESQVFNLLSELSLKKVVDPVMII